MEVLEKAESPEELQDQESGNPGLKLQETEPKQQSPPALHYQKLSSFDEFNDETDTTISAFPCAT